MPPTLYQSSLYSAAGLGNGLEIQYLSRSLLPQMSWGVVVDSPADSAVLIPVLLLFPGTQASLSSTPTRPHPVQFDFPDIPPDSRKRPLKRLPDGPQTPFSFPIHGSPSC